MQAKPPFTIDLNLSIPGNSITFLKRYEPARGRRLANLLEFHGRHSVKAADALMNYAQNKRAENMCNQRGIKKTAKQYEDICDRIYREDIVPLIKCW